MFVCRKLIAVGKRNITTIQATFKECTHNFKTLESKKSIAMCKNEPREQATQPFLPFPPRPVFCSGGKKPLPQWQLSTKEVAICNKSWRA